MGETTLFPDYKQAIDDFLSEGFLPGQVISHEWIDDHLRLNSSDPLYAWQRFGRICQFKATLMEEHKIHLRSIRGIGYEVIAPQEQTKTAVDDAMRTIGMTLGKAAKRLMNVDVAQLDDSGKKENSDAMSRIAALNGMASHSRIGIAGNTGK